jgi:hypothetical protein
MFESISHNKFERASIVAGNFRQFAVQIVWTMQQHAPIHIINSLALSFSRFLSNRLHLDLQAVILFTRSANSGDVVIANTNDRARCMLFR